MSNELVEKGTELVKKGSELVEKTKSAIFNAMDENGDGKVDLEDVIIKGLKIPTIKINRDEFLQKELFKHFPQEVIDIAIAQSPMKANIPLEQINNIADEVIKYERYCVSGISAALGTAGGVAALATIPMDIAQYYGYMLRATQKLLYLYGFPAIDLEEKGSQIDSATMNILILCFGVMNGVANANVAIRSMAKALAVGVEKQLLKKALTKGTIYPIVKSVSKWFGVKMTKQAFAGFFKKAIPIVGGIIGGSLTFLSFKPCCDKLKETLQNTILSNPNYNAIPEEEIIIDDVEVEVVEE